MEEQKRLKTKFAVIKGHAVRLDYAKEKVDKKINEIKIKAREMEKRNIPSAGYRAEEYAKILLWYRNNVEYHMMKIRSHIEDSLTTEQAKKETEQTQK